MKHLALLLSLLITPIYSLKANTCDFYSLEIPVMVDHPSEVQGTLSACPQSHLVQNAAGETLLFTAIRYGSMRAAKILLDAGSNPNHRDRQGQSALFFATTPDQVEELLAAGAKVDMIDAYGRSALSAALEERQFATAQSLLAHQNIIQARDLQWASDHYYRDVLNFLVEHADEQVLVGTGTYFRSFFFYNEEYRELARTLVERGADLNQARMIGSQKSLLQSYVDDYVLNTTPFVQHGTKAIEFLIDHKADVNEYYSRKGKSVLAHLLTKADLAQNLRLLNLFLDAGFNVEQLRNDKTILMELAFFSKYTEEQQQSIRSYARLFTRHARTLNTQDSLGQTALHHAIRWENVPLAKVLIANGIDKTMRNDQGETALEYAYARLGSTPDHSNRLLLVEIIRLLL